MVLFSPEIQKQLQRRNYNKNSHRSHGFVAVSNEYELQTLLKAPTMALCGATAALFIFKSMNYGLKVTDAVICLLIAVFSPESACIVSSPTVFGPNCMV